MVDLDPTATAVASEHADPRRAADRGHARTVRTRCSGACRCAASTIVETRTGASRSTSTRASRSRPAAGTRSAAAASPARSRSATTPTCASASTAPRPPTEHPAPSAPARSGGATSRSPTIPPLCTHAGFCSNRGTDVWDMVRDSADPEVRARMERMIGLCPSGRLALEPPADARRAGGPAGARRSDLGPRRRQLRAADGTDLRGPRPHGALPLRRVAQQAVLRRHPPGDRLP